ncbi:MAG: hypothetical protein AAF666_11370 [Pseudomonadota bacterium]
MRAALTIALLFCLLTPGAAADPRAAFYGTWGTAQQCAGEPIKRGGTVPAEPFEIDEGWLRHGKIWCRLRWFPVETDGDGARSGARASCGEDAVRPYSLRMVLQGGTLTLKWDIFQSTGPLERCVAG